MSGPMPGAACLTCNHPRLAEIHAMIEEGKLSGNKIGTLFGLPNSTVSRHVFKRHPGVVVREGTRWTKASWHPAEKRSSNGKHADEGNEVDKLTTLREQLENDMAARPRSDTARELRQINQRIAEIRGESRPKQVAVADVAGLREQVSRWFEALEPFPEARAAMAAVTDRTLLPDTGPDDA